MTSEDLIANRYRVIRVLGRGGFAVTYLCHDNTGGRLVAVKELAVTDTSGRLVSKFLDEAKLLVKLRTPGVVKIFDAFRWGETAYLVMDYIEGAKTVAQVLKERERLSVSDAKLTLESLAETLQVIHERGYLHRDIKPSNILISSNGEPLLMDFGSAREWFEDATVRHTAMVTPGYSPIEQLSESGKRGPATDLYSLAATGYELLTGVIPPSAPDRIGGKPLPLFSTFRDDVPIELEETLRATLSIKASDRPQSASEFLDLLRFVEGANHEVQSSDLDRMDAILDRLNELKFSHRECPACGSVLENPKPIKPGTCPVCRSGSIVLRDLEFVTCAACMTGVLQRIQNLPIHFCPQCRVGQLSSKGLLKKRLDCNVCGAAFQKTKKEYSLLKLGSAKDEGAKWLSEMATEGQTFSEEFLLDRSGRSEWIRVCDDCGAQWDEVLNSKLKLTYDPSNKLSEYATQSLTEEEWARLSQSLSLDAGNAICNTCDADYFLEEDSVTLLDAERDAFGFLHLYQGRRLQRNQISWLAVGKLSGENGLLCRDCGIEFDYSGDYLRLREAPGPPLSFWIGKPLPFEDWHRVSRGLPQHNEQDQFIERFNNILKRELLTGNIEWDANESNVCWSSTARAVDAHDRTKLIGPKGHIKIKDGILEFQSRLSRMQIPLDAISDIEAMEDVISLKALGHREVLRFKIEPIELQIPLRSGTYDLLLTASDLQNLLSEPDFTEAHLP